MEAGTSTLDHDPDEQKRKQSINLAIGSLEHEGVRITIVDTHVTTIVSAAILFLFGTGPVKGFAVTLIFGIAASMITAVFVTRTFFMIWLQRRPAMSTLSI